MAEKKNDIEADSENKLKSDFDSFDDDGNGVITKDEIRKLMAFEGFPEETINEIVEDLDNIY